MDRIFESVIEYESILKCVRDFKKPLIEDAELDKCDHFVCILQKY